MNFLNPWGLLGLSALIPIIALYFLKLKREERVVPSTLLWKKVLEDMQVNAPFQRLKYSLLLLLQLLLIALLGFALARPYLSLSGYSGQKIVLLIDTSASMATRDAGANGNLTRLDAALRDARAKADDLRQNDEMSIVAFDKDVRQLSKFTTDRAVLKQILSSLQTRDSITRADEAIETALAISEGRENARVLVLSDGCFGEVKMLKGEDRTVKGNLEEQKEASPVDRMKRRLANFRFISYGRENSDNIGITQIEARSRPVKVIGEDGQRLESIETQIFVMVENFSPKDKNVVLSLSTSDVRFPTKAIRLKARPIYTESLNSEPAVGGTSEGSKSIEVFKLPPGTKGVVTAHLDAPKDGLSADDTASVVVGTTSGIKLLLVSKGNGLLKVNYFLEKALKALHGVTLTTMDADEFSKLWDQKGALALEGFDASVFDGAAPISWTDGGALFLGVLPPVSGFGKAEKPLEWPSVLDWDVSHPLMRYVNFGNVTVAKAQVWTVPKSSRVFVEGTGGPLAVAFENDRMRAVGISFDIFDSDWAYRPSLPLFLRNAIPWIAEASPHRHPTAQQTGEPLVVPPGLGAPVATLHRPDGSLPEKVELSQEHTTFIKGTEKSGLYHLKGLPDDVDRVYAVNLVSSEESNNSAHEALKVGEVTMNTAHSAIEAKREIWPDLALGVAALLMLEWWVFHRRVGM